MEPGFILAPQFNSQSQEIFHDEAREFFDVRYRPHRELLVNSGKDWIDGWTQDPINKKLADQWAGLIKDLLLGENGNIVWKGRVCIFSSRSLQDTDDLAVVERCPSSHRSNSR